MTNYVPGPYEVTTITPETRGFRTTTMQVLGGAYQSAHLRDYQGEPVTLHKMVANIQGVEPVYSADGDIMHYQPTAEARATARLFAVAPELVDAAEAFIQAFSKHCPPPESFEVVQAALNLRYQIARARGEDKP